MQIKIKVQDPTPIYEQIASAIEGQIASGALGSGEQLPSIRALATELNVSVITTKKAYDVLQAKGLIIVLPQRGAYVAELNRMLMRMRAESEIGKKTRELYELAKKSGLSSDEFLSIVRNTIDD